MKTMGIDEVACGPAVARSLMCLNLLTINP